MVLLRAFVIAATLAAALPGPPLLAQTDDAVFGAWRWAPEPLGSRPAGLGSAYVAVADSVKAASVNPAGLALVPDWELGVSSLRLWTGAARGGRHVRLAAYFSEADTPSSGGPAVADGDRLTARVREVGVAGAVSPLRGVRLGVTASWAHLRLDGDPAAAAPGASLSLAGESTRLRWTAGLLVDLVGRRPGVSVPSLRLGVALQPGFDWSVDRSVGTPDADRIDATTVDLRRPSVASAGLAWRASGRWTVAGQAELIRYREVLDTLSRNVGPAASGVFELADAVEPRLGLEFASHLSCGCGNVRVRAGVRGQSPGSLRYAGSDSALAQAFPGARWRTLLTLGGSFVGEYFGRALRLDLDSADVLEGPRLSVGATVRF